MFIQMLHCSVVVLYYLSFTLPVFSILLFLQPFDVFFTVFSYITLYMLFTAYYVLSKSLYMTLLLKGAVQTMCLGCSILDLAT